MALPARPKKKVKPATVATAEQIRSRQRGALLGLCVGEALGIPQERRNLPAVHFPKLNDGPVQEPLGGGRFDLPAGHVSWASELAQILSTTLRTHRRYDVTETAKAYAQWLAHAVDAPDAVKGALALVQEGMSAELAGRRIWLEGFQRVRDNASLARTAPLGVFFHSKRDERVNASFADSAITHFDPVCQLACATLNGMVAAAITFPGERLPAEALLKAAEGELLTAASALSRKEPDWGPQTKDATDALREDLKLAQRDDPELYGPDLHLFFPWPSPCRTSFRLAVWEALHAPSLEAALVDVVNRGGDSDTNAAITGALFGALFGETAIPAWWVERVMGEFPRSARTPAMYHPRNLVTLAGLSPL